MCIRDRADTAEELVTLLESHAEGMPLNDVGATRSDSGDQRDQADERREPYDGITVIEAVCDRAHRRQTVESLEGRVAVLHRRQAQ